VTTAVTLVYHITHINNLEAIIDEGGLRCDRAVADRQLAERSLAHTHIKERRAKKPVPVCAGGTLADYVPFYFGPRSPMLFVISRGGVEGHAEGQGPVLHLEASAERIADAGLSYAFTDGHAVMAYSDFYDDLSDLSCVDLDLMKERYWQDTNDDNDRKRRRQAEFLVHDFLPWDLVERIGVLNATYCGRVEELVAGCPHTPEVTVARGWYY